MNTSAVFRSRFRRHFWLYVIAAVASLGGLLAGFDMGVISGALLFINDTWNMSDFTKGWVVSSAIVGAVIGAAGNGFLSDIYGRKKVIIATALIFAVGSVICAAAPSEYNWRWMLLSGLFPALVMLIGISFLGDTPRWLISKKREDEARRIFLDIDPDCNPEQQIKEIRQTIKRAQKNDGHSGFQRWMLMPVFVGVGMMFMQICTGINTIIYYTTTIFKVAGFSSAIGAIYATIGIGFVNFFMTFVAIVFADRIGRKPLLYAGLSGVTVSLFALGASFWFADALGDNLKWMAVGSVVVYIASFAFSLGPIGWIVVSEILPLKIRGLAMSICTVANMAFNFVVVLTFLPLINSVGEARTFWMYGIIGIFCLFFTYRYLPETKGRSLEQIEKNWAEGVPARKF